MGCPTCERYDYCIDLWLDAVKKIIEFSDFQADYLLVDNSKEDDFFRKLKDKNVNIARGPYSDNVRKRIADSRNILRDKVLDENYDFLFSLEQDMIPEKDILKKLLSNKKKIVSAYYSKPVQIAVQDTETNEIRKIQIELSIAYIQDGKMIRRANPNEILGKGLVKAGAFGIGCALISREALEKIKFRCESGKKAFDDMFFCSDAKKEGYGLFLDSEVKVSHLHKEWEVNL